jgi:hypothetical protein
LEGDVLKRWWFEGCMDKGKEGRNCESEYVEEEESARERDFIPAGGTKGGVGL